jgi:hypothetical protein
MLVAPVPALQPLPAPNKPSKEYIYAGGRLLATEEPRQSAPTAPTDFQLRLWCSVYATWTDNSTNETGFKIEWSSDGTNFSLFTTVEANVTSVYLGSRFATSKLWYRVRAINGTADSVPSAAVNVPPLCKTCVCAEGSLPTQSYSLSVNGTSAYVNVPNSPSINVTGPITVEAWVKTNLDGTFFNRVISRYSETGGGYILDLYHNKVRFCCPFIVTGSLLWSAPDARFVEPQRAGTVP